MEQKRLNIPPPIYSAVEIALERATQAAESKSNPSSKPTSPVKEEPLSLDDRQDRWGWADYFTLGYGKDWGGPGTEITDPKSPRDRGRTMTKETEMDSRRSGVKAPLSITVGVAAPIGRYQIGLMDDLDDDEEDVLRSPTSAQDEVNLEGPGRSAEPTISSKTVWISLKEPMHSEEDGTAPREAEYKQLLAAGRGKSTEYRVVLYTNPPFLFCFIFDASTESLSTPKIYRQIHHQIGTLQAPLLLSTDRTRSLAPFSNQSSPSKKRSSNPLYDFVYDPLTLHTICSIPNVPESPPAELPASRSTSQNRQTPWTRMEALNVHTQILQTVAQIRGQIGELERTCKTHRGWWIVWMALPVAVGADPLDNPKAAPIASSAASASSVPSQSVVSELSQDQIGTAEVKVVRREAFLVRKAGDDNRDKGKSSATQRISLLRLGRQESSELSDQSAVAGWTSGIGLDGRKYINDLLRLAFS